MNWKHLKTRQPTFAAYGIAVLAVGLATIARFQLDPILGIQYTYITFYLALLVSAWLGGLRTGLLALILGALSSSYFFTAPRHVFTLGDVPHRIGLLAYLVVGGTAIVLSEAERRSRLRTESVVCQLEREITERVQAEQRLDELQALAERRLIELDAIIESVPDAVFFANETGVTKCNTNALKMAGAAAISDLQASVSELGKKFEVRWPDNGQLLKAEELPFNRALRGEIAIDEMMITRLDNGANVYIRGASGPVIQEGRIIGAAAIYSDITERKQEEIFLAALSKLGQRLNSAITQKEAARIIGEIADELFGWDAFSLNRYDLERSHVHSILNVDTVGGQRSEFPPQTIQRSIPLSVHRIMKNGGELVLKDNPLVVMPDSVPFGDTSRPSASLMFVPIRDRTRAIGVLTVQSYAPRAYTEHDLGMLQTLGDYCAGALERIQAEEALLKSESRERIRSAELQALMDAIPTPVWVAHDPACCMITGNRAAYEFVHLPLEGNISFSAPANEVPTNHCLHINGRAVTGDELPMQQSALTGKPVNGIELEFVFGDGTSQYVYGNAVPLFDEQGAVRGALGAFMDITERKRAEISMAALSKLGQSLNSASTPVQAARVIANIADELFQWDAFGLNLFSEKENQFHHVLNIDLINGEKVEFPAKSMNLTAHAGDLRMLITGAELILKQEPLTMLPDSAPYGDTSRPSASILRVPIRDKLKVRGMLSIHSYTLNAYDQTDLNTLQTFADYCSSALERIEAEQAQRLSEQQYRTFTEAIPAIVFTAGVQPSCEFLNQRWTDYTGLTMEQSLGEGWRSALHPDEVDYVRTQWRQARENSKPFEMIYRIRRHDGAYRWFLMRGLPFFADAGQNIKWLGTATDIHDRKEAEEALAFCNQRLSLIAQITNTVVGTAPLKDQMYELAGIVRAAYRVETCIIRILEGEELHLLACSGSLENNLALVIPANEGIGAAMISNKAPLFIPDVRVNPITGSCSSRAAQKYHFLSYAGAPLLVQDQVIGVLGIYSESQICNFSEADLEHLQIVAHHIAAAVINDSLYHEVNAQKSQLEERIVERQEAENEIERLNGELERRVLERTAQLQASNRELEAFCYSVSHDLRWPLRTITGFSQALKDDYLELLDVTGIEYLDRVINAGREMDGLINDLLHLSRLTRVEMKRRSVDLSALAQKIAGELRQAEPHRSVEFLINPNLIAAGDERLLRIALENLFNNAWKFTGKREQAKIEFGLETGSALPAYFVRDNGAGFDMAYVEKLFGAFQRLHSSSEFPGHGIGLATVQRIINRHGGHTWAQGEVDKGATIYFSLPK